jgi:hypothetical protein
MSGRGGVARHFTVSLSPKFNVVNLVERTLFTKQQR